MYSSEQLLFCESILDEIIYNNVTEYSQLRENVVKRAIAKKEYVNEKIEDIVLIFDSYLDYLIEEKLLKRNGEIIECTRFGRVIRYNHSCVYKDIVNETKKLKIRTQRHIKWENSNCFTIPVFNYFINKGALATYSDENFYMSVYLYNLHEADFEKIKNEIKGILESHYKNIYSFQFYDLSYALQNLKKGCWYRHSICSINWLLIETPSIYGAEKDQKKELLSTVRELVDDFFIDEKLEPISLYE